MSLKILIVDDEALARSRLRAMLEEIGLGETVGEATSGEEAWRLVEALAPDVVLLDISMPGLDGLALARRLAARPHGPAVIFITAHEQHALAAFDAEAVGYLLKPVRSARLRDALMRAALVVGVPAETSALPAEHPAPRTHLSAVVRGSLRVVPVSEVLYLQADRGYITVRHTGGELLLEESLRGLEEEFGNLFLRVHRNALVALARVSALERDAKGMHFVRLRDLGETLPVSRRLLGTVKRCLRHLVVS